MFETEVKNVSSFTAWCAQQLTAPILVWLLTFVISTIPEHIFSREFDGKTNKSLDAFLSTILFWILGFVLAILIGREFPRFVTTGKWIWVLPSSILATWLLADLARFPSGAIFHEYFFPNGEGEQGLVAYLVTFPTYASIAYSLGMRMIAVRSSTKAVKNSVERGQPEVTSSQTAKTSFRNLQ